MSTSYNGAELIVEADEGVGISSRSGGGASTATISLDGGGTIMLQTNAVIINGNVLATIPDGTKTIHFKVRNGQYSLECDANEIPLKK